MAKEYEIKSSDGESLTLPTSWMEGVSRPFSDCTSLTGVIIPEGVTEIDDHAFEGCTSLSSVIIPSSVTKIGKFAFARCISLTTISIPGNVADIEVCAFVCCTSLKEIRYGGTKEQWETVEKGDFWYKNTYVQKVFCSDDTVELPAYSIEDGVLACWYRLVPEAVIPECVMKIDDFAFYDCMLLSSVVIPESVTKIGYSAFSNCTLLAYVNIIGSLTEIENYAFGSCSSLKEIHYGGTKEQWKAVKKEPEWNDGVPAKCVVCTDGTVKL